MPQPDAETPTLSDVLKLAVEARLLDLHVSLPAEIVSYDGRSATVQPLIKRVFTDGVVVDLPPITKVPVIWPGDNDSIIVFPIKAGSTGTLLFSERSMDLWKVQGGKVNPDDTRKFDISDAQFIPGLRSLNVDTKYDPDRIRIINQDGEISISKEGRFKFTNGTVEFVELMIDLIDEILLARTNTMLGPQPLVPQTGFLLVKNKLEQLKD